MIQNRLWCLPLCALTLLFLAACQAGPEGSSNAADRVLGGAAPSPCQNMCSIIKGNAGNQCVSLCEGIQSDAANADLNSKALLSLAFSEWQAGNLLLKGKTTAEQALQTFNADLRGLTNVMALEDDELHEWTIAENLGTQDLVAIGPTTSLDPFCFPSGKWCFQIVQETSQSYSFAAEAIGDQNALGECVGSLPNDCEQIGVHMDVSLDSAADSIRVWSCSEDFVSLHYRFPVLEGGDAGSGEPGEPTTDVPAPIEFGFDCAEGPTSLQGWQQWVWTGLQPLRWAAGVEPLGAGTAGTTFARASFVQGASTSPRTRDILCIVSAKFASISDGAECKLFAGNSPLNPPVESCTTQRTESDGPKSARCSLLDIPVPDDNTPYYLVVDKQEQTSTAHHAEAAVARGLWPGDPARDEFRVCDVNLSTGNVNCQNNVTGSLD